MTTIPDFQFAARRCAAVRVFSALLPCLVGATAATGGTGAGTIHAWPIPSTVSCGAGSAALSAAWKYDVEPSVASIPVVASALDRYKAILNNATGSSHGSIATVSVAVTDTSPQPLSPKTNESYTVSGAGDTVAVTAHTPWGVGYALETLSQLIAIGECGAPFAVSDGPRFPHRGIMIDTGRRFYPVALVKQIMDGMSMVKMNVLHFHLSEECFRVQSKTFPNLTAQCNSGGRQNDEVYSHEDIGELVAYAANRSIRVVPEFDMPGHSGGFCTNLASAGLQCCGGQIEDDPAGKSVAIIQQVLTEMASIFPDPVMNLGCDETGSSPPCTLNNTKSFEVKMIEHLLSLGKQPMGWEEILFKTGAAAGYPTVIVDSWARTSWSEAASLGHPVVDSRVSPFYLDYPGHSAASMWLDLTDGNTNASELALLLGGEVSMWSDRYVGSCMFTSPSADANFSRSTSNCVWPRSVVAAGSFWGYVPAVAATDPAFNASFLRAQAELARRGVQSCPCTTLTSTSCSQSDECGVDYCAGLPPPPPPSSTVLRCSDFNATAGLECHTAWTGDPSLALKGGPATVSCASPDDCLAKADAACRALAGCAIFSLASAKGAASPAVSFFSKPSAPANKNRTSSLWGVACDASDPAQAFTFGGPSGAITHKSAGGATVCVDFSGAEVPLPLKPCDGSAAQNFTHAAGGAEGPFRSGGQCIDMFYGGKGPGVGRYSCDNDWNQAWVATAAGQWEEQSDGRCISDSPQGKPGLVFNGNKGVGSANAWTTY